MRISEFQSYALKEGTQIYSFLKAMDINITYCYVISQLIIIFFPKKKSPKCLFKLLKGTMSKFHVQSNWPFLHLFKDCNILFELYSIE